MQEIILFLNQKRQSELVYLPYTLAHCTFVHEIPTRYQIDISSLRSHRSIRTFCLRNLQQRICFCGNWIQERELPPRYETLHRFLTDYCFYFWLTFISNFSARCAVSGLTQQCLMPALLEDISSPWTERASFPLMSPSELLQTHGENQDERFSNMSIYQ